METHPGGLTQVGAASVVGAWARAPPRGPGPVPEPAVA